MENQEIEYKESWRDEYLKIISAFANTNGGTLYIGIRDNNEIKGVENPDKLLEDIPNKVKNRLYITPSVKLLEREDKKIISIEVDPANFPVFFDGKIFVRVGSTTQELLDWELASFLQDKTGKSWDSIETEASLDDIDKETVERFILMAKPRLPLIDNTKDTLLILKNLSLITDKGKLTRGALILFGKNPQTFFISAYTRGGRFKNNITITDSKDFYGNLFKQLDDAMEFILKHINVRFDIKVSELSLEGLARKEVWDYPLEAIREAIINALIHRDYNDYTSTVEIRIFDDKVSIYNPGKLPPPLSIEDLKRPHEAKPRNPLIAKVFYYAGLIEQWGSGTTRMISLCKEQGLPEPEFEERKEGVGSFKVIFYKDIYTEENLRRMGLNERQIKAIMYVKERGKITLAEYKTLISDIAEKTLYRDLQDLVKKEILKPIGDKKGRYYEILR